MGLIKKPNQIRDLTFDLAGNSAICPLLERSRDADDGVGDAGTLNGRAMRSRTSDASFRDVRIFNVASPLPCVLIL